MLPVAAKVPVAGLYSSALVNAPVGAPEPFPPAINTIPLFNNVAVAPYRPLFKLPVVANPGVTVSSAALLLIPFADAVIAADPGSSAVVTPLLSPTVATLVVALVHVNTTPGIGFPPLSCATAVNCAVDPTAIESVPGLTTIDATVGAAVGPPPHPVASSPQKHRPAKPIHPRNCRAKKHRRAKKRTMRGNLQITGLSKTRDTCHQR
jgi:hypothetical protein